MLNEPTYISCNNIKKLNKKLKEYGCKLAHSLHQLHAPIMSLFASLYEKAATVYEGATMLFRVALSWTAERMWTVGTVMMPQGSPHTT